MKSIITSFLLLALISCSCSDNKASNDTTDTTTKSSESSNSSPSDDDIVGEWELVGSIVDTNDNLQLDEEEKKNLKPAVYKDYMNLNSDGSGLFTVAKMEGRYEIKEDASNGRKVMTWYDKANGPHRVGSIMKVTKDELTIKEPGGHGLFLWKRL